MTPRKLRVIFAYYNYAGNGGVSAVHPSLIHWSIKTFSWAKAHPHVESVHDCYPCDTPITMTRNRTVRQAKAIGADVLLMVDSDQQPDCEVGDPFAKPFFESSFEFLLSHFDRGPCAIFAPYCGPPPNECVYVFKWHHTESDDLQPFHKLEMYDREHAAIMGGIVPCAAAPTGLSMWDMRLFELKKPPYFYYEYKDEWQDEKGSTEDVTCTRDLSIAGHQKLGYNPIYCNWDAWAGHVKPKCVRKPRIITSDQVAARYSDALNQPTLGEHLIEVGADGKSGVISAGPVPEIILERSAAVDAARLLTNGHAGRKVRAKHARAT